MAIGSTVVLEVDGGTLPVAVTLVDSSHPDGPRLRVGLPPTGVRDPGTVAVSFGVQGGAIRLTGSVVLAEEELELTIEDVQPVQRRRHVRVFVEVPLVATISTGAATEGKARDLSASGVRITFPNDSVFLPGARVRLTLQLPAGPLHVSAMAVGLSPKGGFGFQFVDLAPNAEDAICAYVFAVQREQLRQRRRHED
ncbi:PilZ domain-containing protein [Motilibacter rhizosphaerae]|uniref:PilZ domain-containing protein n=1 Tax=Motilibacter rhizosphaerae TaxID=598652 RepID=UPI0013EEA42B|nr:PilZ domain-containing protein [Motilibacter rhizosphaerae]